jgi:ubiquinone/menaquinone biosynthesis C-methylase UbiE
MPHKADAEIAFWKSRLQKQGVLTNDHFEYFYTTHFGLEKVFYRGKRIVDIGCGPRGSLEWATEADIRIGIDPLARMYRQLGTNCHSMQYVACGAENLPFSNGTFDVVSSFNSLDHVDDLNKVIDEISRVLTPQGYFLLSQIYIVIPPF